MNTERQATAWMKSRAPVWNAWLSQSQQPDRRLSVEDAQQRIGRYRAIARDLATARQMFPNSSATAAIEALYVTTHASIDRSARYTKARLLYLLRDEIPEVIAWLRPTILWLALLMFVFAIAGWWLLNQYPDLISLVASPNMIHSVEQGHLWTEDLLNVVPSSVMSIRILSNNISVSLLAFCFGVFFGLGSFYLVATNGFLLGATFAFTRHYGLDGELLKFVLAHGPVELSVICIAGAAGTALGESLIRPTEPTRRESFQHAASRIARVLLACCMLLIVCGVIEGFISPNPGFPMISRAVIGISYWLIMLLFLRGKLIR